MKLFKGAPPTDEPSKDVLIRIEVKRSQVKGLVIRCQDSKTLYKGIYETSKSNIFAYHTELETLENYAKREGLEVVDKSTNIDLPYVRNVKKRMR